MSIITGEKLDALEELYRCIEVLKQRIEISVGKEFKEHVSLSSAREDLDSD